MTTPPIARYRPRSLLIRMGHNLGMSVAQLVAAAGLPRAVALDPSASVTAAQIFQIWETVDNLVPGGITVEHVRENARGPFSAQTFAFSCSPDVATGLDRLVVFKPLSGPYRLRITKSDRLCVEFTSTDPTAPIPERLYGMEIVHLLELIRLCTGNTVVPLAVTMPAPTPRSADVATYAGVEITEGPLGIHLALDDAARPLLSANAEQWATFEPGLMRQLAASRHQASVVDELRAALFETLPTGQASARAAAAKLTTSTRSLQRRLQAHGTSFGTVLEDTRRELALHYLTQDHLRVEEISYLLAFRDPNSFYRAFQAWTGMTPRAARLASMDRGADIAV
ncbi:MAG: helix-turn-helix domain-containing protein [Pseudomonadota bacterium]